MGQVEEMQIGLVGRVVGKDRGIGEIVINDSKLASNLQERFTLLSNKAQSITSLIVIAGHMREGKVLVIVEVGVDGEVGVAALGELEEGGDEELAGGEGEEGGWEEKE